METKTEASRSEGRRPDVGPALGLMLGLRRAGTMAAQRRAWSPLLHLRRGVGAATLAGSPPTYVLPFALRLPGAAFALAARRSSETVGAAPRAPVGQQPLVWSAGISAPWSKGAPAAAPLPSVGAVPFAHTPGGVEPQDGVEWPPVSRSPAAPPADGAYQLGGSSATAAPGSEVLPVHDGAASHLGRAAAAPPWAVADAPLLERAFRSAARARLGAIAPAWSLLLAGPGPMAATLPAPRVTAPPPHPPSYTAAAGLPWLRANAVLGRANALPAAADGSGPHGLREGRTTPVTPELDVLVEPAPGARVALDTTGSWPLSGVSTVGAAASAPHDGGATAAAAADPASLIERRVGTGALSLAGLPILAAPIKRWVAGEVTQQVARATEPRPAPPAPPPPKSIDVQSDEFVRRLLVRVRAMAQEERFRGGLLR